MLNALSKLLYGGARKTRDVRAVEKAIKTGSVTPIAKRIVNKWIGRNVVSKLWIK